MKIADAIQYIVCDDVRDEVGNKVSLMGVYAENITVPALPAMVRQICFVAMLKGIKKAITHVEATMTVPGGEPAMFKLPAPPNQLNLTSFNIVVAISPIRIKEEGDLTWEIVLNKNEKMKIQHSMPIITPKAPS